MSTMHFLLWLIIPRPHRRWGVMLVIFLCCACLAACGLLPGREVLIAVHPADIPLLRDPGNPNPFDTGIPALDELNRQWDVEAMTPVYPDIDPTDPAAIDHGLAGVFKLVVPRLTDIDALLAAYEADAHIAYAEFNEPVTFFGQ